MYTFCIEWFFNMFSVIIYVNTSNGKKIFYKTFKYQIV